MSHGPDVEAGEKLPTSRCYKPFNWTQERNKNASAS